MSKHMLISAGLSLLVIILLPLHAHLVSALGDQEWLNMAIGLPIGVATAFNVDILIHKIRPPQNKK